MARNVFQSIADRFRPPPEPIATPHALRSFLDTRSAYVTQRVMVEYSRSRAGLHWRQLEEEADFQKALEAGRWQAFPAVLGDLSYLTGSKLLGQAGPENRSFLPALATLAASIVAAYGPPAGRPDGFRPECNALTKRLLALGEQEPAPAHVVAQGSGDALYEALPIHLSLRPEDRPLVQRATAFTLITCLDDFTKRADKPALLQALSGDDDLASKEGLA